MPVQTDKSGSTIPLLLNHGSSLNPLFGGREPTGSSRHHFLTHLRSRFGYNFFTGSGLISSPPCRSSQQVIHRLFTQNGPASCGARRPEPNRNGAECPGAFQVAEISASVPQIPLAHAVRKRTGPTFFAEFSRQVPFPLRGKGTGPTNAQPTQPTPGVLRHPYLERYPQRSPCKPSTR